MSDNVYSITEIAGSSSESVEAAIDNALTRARKNSAQPRLVRAH